MVLVGRDNGVDRNFRIEFDSEGEKGLVGFGFRNSIYPFMLPTMDQRISLPLKTK